MFSIPFFVFPLLHLELCDYVPDRLLVVSVTCFLFFGVNFILWVFWVFKLVYVCYFCPWSVCNLVLANSQ
jgi:hypothetical protein